MQYNHNSIVSKVSTTTIGLIARVIHCVIIFYTIIYNKIR